MSLGRWDDDKYSKNPNESQGLGKWESYPSVERAIEQQKPKKNLIDDLPPWAKELGLGLGQWGIDTVTGLPEQFKRSTQFGMGGPGAKAFGTLAESLQQKLPDRPNLEKYSENPEGLSEFNVGRYGPDVLGLIGGGIKQASKLSNKAVGTNIVNTANKIGEVLKGRYNNFFNKADEALAEKLKREPPKIKKEYTMDSHPDIPLNVKESIVKPGEKILNKEQLANFKAGSDSDINRPIDRFISEPTFENAHWAKSSINQLKREFRRLKASRGLTPTETEARYAAHKLEKQLNDYIKKELDILNPAFKKEYKKLGQDYAKDYGPFLGNRDIRQARFKPTEEGFIEPWRLPSELAQKSGDPFRRAKLEQFPDLFLNRKLAGPLGKLLAGSGTIGLAAPFIKKLLEES